MDRGTSAHVISRPMLWLRILVTAGRIAPIPGVLKPSALQLRKYARWLAGPQYKPGWRLRGTHEHASSADAKLMACTILYHYSELRTEDEPLTVQDLIPYALNNC